MMQQPYLTTKLIAQPLLIYPQGNLPFDLLKAQIYTQDISTEATWTPIKISILLRPNELKPEIDGFCICVLHGKIFLPEKCSLKGVYIESHNK